MNFPDFKQLCDLDIDVTYLSASKLTIKQTKKEFVCYKGTRLFARFFLVLNGETTFNFITENGIKKCITARCGDVVYLPNDINYTSTWKNANEIDHISIEFTLNYPNGEILLLNDEIFVITHDKNGLLHNAFEEIYKTWCSDDIGYRLKCRSMFYSVLLKILQDCLRREYKAKHNEIYKGILYINNNYLNEISVKELAKMCGMCETRFRQKFKNQIGKTPIEYKNYLRIKKAAELLDTGEYSVSEAAYAVNIPDLAYFNKMFKSQYKITPRNYKRHE